MRVLRLKVPQVAELLGCSTDTIEALIAEGVFGVQRDSDRPKAHRYILSDEVEQYVELLPRGKAYAVTVLRERRGKAGAA